MVPSLLDLFCSDFQIKAYPLIAGKRWDECPGRVFIKLGTQNSYKPTWKIVFFYNSFEVIRGFGNCYLLNQIITTPQITQ